MAIEFVQLLIIGAFIYILMHIIREFHLLTFILILIPWIFVFTGILFQLTITNSLFIPVIIFSILSYTQILGKSFFDREVFKSTNQYVIFFIYVVLVIISSFYTFETQIAAVGNILIASLILVIGFYHFNNKNISKNGIILSVLLGFLTSSLYGWIALGLFYYKGKKAVNRA